MRLTKHRLLPVALVVLSLSSARAALGCSPCDPGCYPGPDPLSATEIFWLALRGKDIRCCSTAEDLLLEKSYGLTAYQSVNYSQLSGLQLPRMEVIEQAAKEIRAVIDRLHMTEVESGTALARVMSKISEESDARSSNWQDP